MKIHTALHPIGQNGGHNLPKSMVGSVIVYENRIIGKAGIKAEPCRSKCNQFSKRQIPLKESHHLCKLRTLQPFWKTPPVLI
jgi:hypothetical protein